MNRSRSSRLANSRDHRHPTTAALPTMNRPSAQKHLNHQKGNSGREDLEEREKRREQAEREECEDRIDRGLSDQWERVESLSAGRILAACLRGCGHYCIVTWSTSSTLSFHGTGTTLMPLWPRFSGLPQKRCPSKRNSRRLREGYPPLPSCPPVELEGPV